MNVINRERPELRFTSEVERSTAHLFDKVRKVIPAVEWPHQPPKGAKERGDPGPQLYDPRDISLRRRHDRGFPRVGQERIKNQG